MRAVCAEREAREVLWPVLRVVVWLELCPVLWWEDEEAWLDFDFADGVWDFFFFLAEAELEADVEL